MNTRDRYLKETQFPTHSFVPRIPLLQSLNGSKIELPPSLNRNALAMDIGRDAFNHIKWLFAANNLNLDDCFNTGKVGNKNLSKWLAHSNIPEGIVSKICAARIARSELTLTTRYKDFARMGSSAHFSTCAVTDSRGTIAYYLHKSNTFLLIGRDSKGDFSTRIVGRVVRVTRSGDWFNLGVPEMSLVILLNKSYGIVVNAPPSIGGIPCFAQTDYRTPFDILKERSSTLSSELILYNTEAEKPGDSPGPQAYDDLFRTPEVVIKTGKQTTTN